MKLKKLDALGKPYAIYAEHLESQAIDQFVDAMSQDSVLQGALMPDAHAGYTLPIGSVVAVDGQIFPSGVGYDIGCGMVAIKTSFSNDAVRQNAQAIFDAIYAAVPVGFNRNAKAPTWKDGESLPRTKVLEGIISKKGLCDLHSLGGGNHFAEIAEDESGVIWVVIHSGSRNLGHTVASHYMALASDLARVRAGLPADGKAREGFYGLDVRSQEGRDYIVDMDYCLAFALENRRGMISRIEKAIRGCLGHGEALWDTLVNRNHNHAERRVLDIPGRGEREVYIHRKGATHAEDGMMGVVPGCMRDGSFLVRGKGNPDSLFSSSHGAGRVMGRAEAKRKLNMETFVREMSERGIVARVEEATLDESAGAYKDIFEVMAQQSDLVEVIHHLRPIINIKG